MRAGQLDRQINVFLDQDDPLLAPPLADGTPTTAARVGRIVRAHLIQSSTEEYQRAYGEGGNTSVIFRIRWMPDVTVKHGVEYDGRILNIREVKEIGRRNGLELRCEEVRT